MTSFKFAYQLIINRLYTIKLKKEDERSGIRTHDHRVKSPALKALLNEKITQ